MKPHSLFLIVLVVVALAGVAQAGAGPTSPLYLTTGSSNILVVQGNSITSFPEAYASPNEFPIAVYGDVRTVGAHLGWAGGQYTLGGTPTGTSYALPPGITSTYDSTTDGSHNYLVEWFSGTVFQNALDFTNPVIIFNIGATNPEGVSYDATNNSLWISDYSEYAVADYSLSGTLLTSFNTGHYENAALAFDPPTTPSGW